MMRLQPNRSPLITLELSRAHTRGTPRRTLDDCKPRREFSVIRRSRIPLSLAGLVAALALTACAPPHTTLRRELRMSIWEPVNERTIESAFLRRFPVGTARDALRAALPRRNAPAIWVAWVCPWFDWWEAHDAQVYPDFYHVESTESSALIGRWYYQIFVYFTGDELHRIDVRKSSIAL